MALWADQTSYLGSLQGRKPGEHVGYISGNFAEWRRLIIPFLLEGATTGGQSIYLNDLYTPKQVWSCLAQQEPRLGALRKATSIMVLNSPSFFFVDRCFDPWAAVSQVKKLYQQSLAAGFKSLRLVADMNWVSYCALYYTRFVEYEELVKRIVLPHYPCTLVCQFDGVLFSKQVLETIINIHPLVIKTNREHQKNKSHQEFTKERIMLSGL